MHRYTHGDIAPWLQASRRMRSLPQRIGFRQRNTRQFRTLASLPSSKALALLPAHPRSCSNPCRHLERSPADHRLFRQQLAQSAESTCSPELSTSSPSVPNAMSATDPFAAPARKIGPLNFDFNVSATACSSFPSPSCTSATQKSFPACDAANWFAI